MMYCRFRTSSNIDYKSAWSQRNHWQRLTSSSTVTTIIRIQSTELSRMLRSADTGSLSPASTEVSEEWKNCFVWTIMLLSSSAT